METFISIEPCNLIQVISKIKINVLHILLNESATIQCMCYNDNNVLLNCNFFELTGTDYINWQNDQWLINYVCDKYGYVIKNSEC